MLLKSITSRLMLSAQLVT